MDLMELGKSYVAQRHGLKTMDDVMRFEPFWERYDSSQAGIKMDDTSVFAVLQGGEIPLEQGSISSYGSNAIPDTQQDAPTIGEQLAGIEKTVLGLHFHLHYSCEWEEYREDIHEYLPLEPIDWIKLRRRVEDALRKTKDRVILFGFAHSLNCKIY